MINLDSLLTVLALIQPLLLGTLVILGVGRQFNLDGYKVYGAIRQRNQPSRLYECATYSRLSAKLSYEPNTLGLIGAYLIYDVDLIFLLAECAMLTALTISDVGAIIIFVSCLVLALCYDFKEDGLT